MLNVKILSLAAGTLLGFHGVAAPLVVAHRGLESYAPEGSRPAYELAVKTKCEIVKLDVHETKDGVIVMSHDSGLGRTMDWTTNIIDVTYAEIAERVFKPVGGFAAEKIVTLKEALEIVKPIPEFWIDFKHFTPDFCERSLAAFAAAGIAEERIMVATFTKAALVYMRDRHPNVRRVGHVGYLKNADGTWGTNAAPGKKFPDRAQAFSAIFDYQRQLGLFGVNVPSKWTTKDEVAALRKAGLWVSLWFVNSDKTAAKVFDFGADAYVSSDVVAARWHESVAKGPKVAVFGGSFSRMPAARVAKAGWVEKLDCTWKDYGIGGCGFKSGGRDKTNDVPAQVTRALASGVDYDAFILWASTNDLHFEVKDQDDGIRRTVALIRGKAPKAKIFFFTSMPMSMNPAKNEKLRVFVEAQKRVCAELGVPVLDQFAEADFPAAELPGLIGADKLHPTALGYLKVRDLQSAFLAREMK